MPEKGTTIKFKDFKKMVRSPFVIYADCETIL